MRALQLVVRCVLVAVLVVVPSLSFGTAAYAGDGDKKSDSEKKDKDDHKDDEDNGDKGDDDQGKSDDSAKGEDKGKADDSNDGEGKAKTEDKGKSEDKGKDSGNGQAKGHDKGVGQGHENGNGLGHVKYDSAAGAVPEHRANAGNDGKVTICHQAGGSGTYTKNTVSVHGAASGHSGHGGDVIPPFSVGKENFSGQNYDDVGKALLANDCGAPSAPLAAGSAFLQAARVQTAAVAAVTAAAAAKVTICHATSSQTSPYEQNQPAAQGAVSGHAGHSGPLFQPGATSWGDIIPPFNFGPKLQFAGLNWSADGQAIYANGCEPAAAAAPPGEEDVVICHATGSRNDPYNRLTVAANGTAEGHAAHNGPVFTEDANTWGDIIPPFTFGNGQSFSGQNWTGVGRDMYSANCAASAVLGIADRASDDNDDDDDGGGDGDDDDSDPVQAGGLPHTGGPALWILFVGGLLLTTGVVVRRVATKDPSVE